MKVTLIEIEGSPDEIISVVQRLPGCSPADVKAISAQIELAAADDPVVVDAGPIIVTADSDSEKSLSDRLSDRERQVLYFLMEGVSNKAIGRELDITENTVRTYIKTILGKIGARNRITAALWAQKNLADGRPKLTLVATAR